MVATTRSSRPVSDLSAEVRWYLKSRGYRLPAWCQPAVRTPEPGSYPGAEFHPDRVDKVINVLRCLRHTQGKWRGRPLEPDAWQVAYILAPVFGWVVEDDDKWVRVVRKVYVDIPRKGAKTTLASGLDLYLAFGDDEPGAQVIAVAGAKDQARRCFDPAALIVRHSPELRAGGIRPLRSRIIRDEDGSYFDVVSSVGDLLHGANIHAATVDELHVHKSADVLDAVESGTGARSQPLVIIITTADDSRTDTVYAHERDYVERLARGAVRNYRQYGVVFAADPADDPFVESTWRKANPGYPITPSKAYMADEARKAEQNPANLARFLRLNLGIRTKQETRYLELPTWDRNAGLVDETWLAGRECFGGLDLAATQDLTALCWVFGEDDGVSALWRLWTPEANLRRLDERTAGAASSWAKQGFLTVTPGEVIDYERVRAQINADRAKFRVQEIAFDPWNSSQLVTELSDDGALMVQVRQGFASMSPPTKELLRLCLEGTAEAPKVRHGGNPAVRWQVDNFAVEMDAAGNVKPSKRKAADKIDAVVALIMALDRQMRQPAKKNYRVAGF